MRRGTEIIKTTASPTLNREEPKILLQTELILFEYPAALQQAERACVPSSGFDQLLTSIFMQRVHPATKLVEPRRSRRITHSGSFYVDPIDHQKCGYSLQEYL
jgi:hypothetical protein